MHYQHMYVWLVANGLWRDIESACILVPIMHLMAFKPLTRLHKLLSEILAEVREHIDLEKIEEKVKQ